MDSESITCNLNYLSRKCQISSTENCRMPRSKQNLDLLVSTWVRFGVIWESMFQTDARHWAPASNLSRTFLECAGTQFGTNSETVKIYIKRNWIFHVKYV